MAWSYGSVAAAALLWYVIYDLTSRLYAWQRLRHIPGPFLAGFTDFWMLKTQWGGNWAQELGRVSEKYGPIARIGPNTLVICNADELRRVWSGQSRWKRSYWWYRSMRLDPTKECVLSIRDVREHQQLRAKLLPGYRGRDVDNVEPLIDTEILSFIDLIERKYVSTFDARHGSRQEIRKMELARKVQYFTLDAISSLALGKPFGHLKQDGDVFGYIELTDAALATIFMSSLLPPVLALLQSPLMRPLMPKPEDSFGMGRIIGIARDAVADRFRKEGQRDMLSSFIGHGLTQSEAGAEAAVVIIAGADTTATAIRATFLHIITNPVVYRRLQEEIDTAIITRKVTRPVITDAEAKRLPYLQAVIMEGLRIFPPVTGMMPKMSDADDVVCGKHVPAGTNVGWSALGVMQNTDIFGKDAKMFRPERWLDLPIEKQRSMEQWTYQCFSKGMRSECLGKDIAYLELNKIFFEVWKPPVL
ncbi:hypothetical protein MMC25_001443 [Agyrium rufum]|nr:hypothetical protein [Agyrium rufum]